MYHDGMKRTNMPQYSTGQNIDIEGPLKIMYSRRIYTTKVHCISCIYTELRSIVYHVFTQNIRN